VIREWHPFRCITDVNNIDMSSVTDVGLVTGCCFAWLRVDTKDPSVKSGHVRVMLTLSTAKRMHAIIKNLIEEDELRSEFTKGCQMLKNRPNVNDEQWAFVEPRNWRICFKATHMFYFVGYTICKSSVCVQNSQCLAKRTY
jgi:hypothetical protein